MVELYPNLPLATTPILRQFGPTGSIGNAPAPLECRYSAESRGRRSSLLEDVVKKTTGRNGILALLVLIPSATSVLAEGVSDSMTEGSTLSTGGIRVLVFLLLALGAVLSRRRRVAGDDSAPTVTPPG